MSSDGSMRTTDVSLPREFFLSREHRLGENHTPARPSLRMLPTANALQSRAEPALHAGGRVDRVGAFHPPARVRRERSKRAPEGRARRAKGGTGPSGAPSGGREGDDPPPASQELTAGRPS